MATKFQPTKRDDAPALPERLRTKPEAARYVRLSVRSIENAMREKRLAFVRFGTRAVRFRITDLDAFIARYRVRSVAG